MPQTCCVLGCANRSGRDKVVFFKFPSDGILKEKWAAAIGKPNLCPTHHRVCSIHFINEDYEKRSDVRRLKKTVVPTLFLYKEILNGKNIQVLEEHCYCRSNKPYVSFIKSKSNVWEQSNSDEVLETPIKRARKELFKPISTVINPVVPPTHFDSDIRPLTSSCELKEQKKKKIVKETPIKSRLRRKMKTLGKKVKTLKQKVRRQNKRITNIQELMSTIKTSSDADTSDVIENNFTSKFLQNLINNGKLVPKGRRYCEETKQFATTLFFYSPKAYNYIRSVLSLPNPSSIRNWISNVNASVGFLSDVLIEISKFSNEHKHCCLILDSMSIKKQILWDKANHKY